ncbi:hypothetical protein [Pseudobacteroides cellulosolvens]|uniref:Carboxypeptidase regulatory-like domain-containing protein n=1 Tax=Pseudobacteroides cellulosolvens ATCC 35603 = DSM 2933 TaxID=398512 RepID=A0A0L6JSS2_9FIRM|nr:hypothetical protein [Pseudobacteroides cellulosolvens]KNY28863.1 hypothetical protein Bccel_4137 [Pseudobacteroides cellulosolvens ATCC 35603 = DSM 2933]
MLKIKKCICILLMFFMLSQFSLVFAEQVVNDVPKYKVNGYIKPDFDINHTNSAIVRSNFIVEIVELQLSTVTDSSGYYEIDCIP